MFSGRGDEAGSRLLVGTSVGEVGNRVSLEERRRLSTLLTVTRTVGIAELGGALTTTARARLARTYTTARRNTHVAIDYPRSEYLLRHTVN